MDSFTVASSPEDANKTQASWCSLHMIERSGLETMRTLKLCQKSEYLKLEKDRKHELEHSKDCDARLC